MKSTTHTKKYPLCIERDRVSISGYCGEHHEHVKNDFKRKTIYSVNPTAQQPRMGTCVLSIITSSVGQTAWFHQLDFSLSNRIC